MGGVGWGLFLSFGGLSHQKIGGLGSSLKKIKFTGPEKCITNCQQ